MIGVLRCIAALLGLAVCCGAQRWVDTCGRSEAGFLAVQQAARDVQADSLVLLVASHPDDRYLLPAIWLLSWIPGRSQDGSFSAAACWHGRHAQSWQSLDNWCSEASQRFFRVVAAASPEPSTNNIDNGGSTLVGRRRIRANSCPPESRSWWQETSWPWFP